MKSLHMGVVTREFVSMSCWMLVLALLLAVSAGRSTGAQASSTQQQQGASPFANADRLLELGKFSEAISELETMRSQTPPPQGLAHELGVAYYKKSDYPNAVLNL